jgi:ABC-type oligopeptide transport system substrate-binding subunit
MIPGSGAYAVADTDVRQGQHDQDQTPVDYGQRSREKNVGISNFDEVRVVIVRDRNTEFEKFKKGDTDFYAVNRAQMWAEWLDMDTVKRGLIQKRRIWNNNPNGIQG